MLRFVKATALPHMDDTLPFLKEGACKFSKFKFSNIHKWVLGKLTKYHIMQFTFTVQFFLSLLKRQCHTIL